MAQENSFELRTSLRGGQGFSARLKGAAVASISLLALCAPTAAFAQADDTAATSGGGLEEIVVTAQKREQRLQDVPVAITAISGDSMVANRITTVRDLNALAPNLTVRTQPGGGANPTFSMRGYVNQGSVAGSDRGVALYVDGVYLSNPNGSIFELADIQRVEVLRGPQGTLFGRNSTAGAISFITKEPDHEFGVRLTSTLGNYNQFRAGVRINTGDIGPFAFSLSYVHSERDGDIRNLGAGTTWDFSGAFVDRTLILKSPKTLGGNNLDAFAVAGKFESGDFKTVVRYDYTEQDYSADGFGVLWMGNTVGGIYNAQPDPSILTPVSYDRPDAVNNGAVVMSHAKNWGVSVTSEYRVNDNLSLKNIAAYRLASYMAPMNDISGNGGLLVGGNWLMIQETTTAARNTQWSNEFQLNYDSDFANITLGEMYFEQTDRRAQLGDEAAYGRIRGGAFRTFILGPNGYIVPNVTTAGGAVGAGGRATRIVIKSLAAYGQGEFHVLDNVDLVAGIRYTKDRKSGIDNTTVSCFAAFCAGGVSTAADQRIISYRDSRFTYNLGVNYKPTQDILLYAKYSTGYISGGTLGSLGPLSLTFEPEIAKSWEAGIKADWFDRVLRTNLTVFTVGYDNIQGTTSGAALAAAVGVTNPALAAAAGKITQSLISIGDARVKGVELETTFAPSPGLVFTANGGYQDFKYTRINPLISNGTTGAITPNYRPDWTANVSAQYTTQEPVFGDAILTARIDGNWRSRQNAFLTINATQLTPAEQAAQQAINEIRPYWIWNGRLALSEIPLGGAKGTLAFWGRNLFNNKSPTTTLSVVTMVGTSYESAATYGVDFTLEF